MLTKKQIEQAAHKYCEDNRGDAFEFAAFGAGAEWAAEQVQAEIGRLTERNRELENGYAQVAFYLIRRYEVANMLAGDTEEVMRLQSENAVLRSELEAIIDRDQVIEKAKKVLEK